MAKHGKRYRAAAAKIDRAQALSARRGDPARWSTAAARRSSTRPSRSRCGSASTRGRPTRTCAARSCCRTAPARRVRVLVFAKGEKAKEAEEAGADLVGADDLAKKIQDEQWLDFDTAIATPDMMGAVGRLGKVLGPRGLMPNPKVGTVTFDVAQGGARGEGRQGRVPRREGRHRARADRQASLRRREAHSRTRTRFVASLRARQAGGGQGQLPAAACGLDHHGPGRHDRPARRRAR